MSAPTPYFSMLRQLYGRLSPLGQRNLWVVAAGLAGSLLLALLGMGVLAFMARAHSAEGEIQIKSLAPLSFSKDFFSDRSPKPYVAPAAVAAAPAEAEWVDAPGLTLNGTVNVGGTLKAIMAGDGGQSYYVSQGGRVGRFVVLAVEKNRVILVESALAGRSDDLLSNPGVKKYVVHSR